MPNRIARIKKSLITTSVGKDLEKLEPLQTDAGSVKMVRPLWKQSNSSSET